MKRAALSVLLLAGGCTGGPAQELRKPKTAVFVGVDVSGSFRKDGLHDDALKFLSYYIYGHLKSRGGLHPMKALFVGAIGGEFEDDPKSFRPIQDFEGRTPEQIEADLKAWFPQKDVLSDFNVFFKQAAHIAQKRNLALSPITVLLLSDGVPATAGRDGKPRLGHYDEVELAPLEFLSRKVTVRLLYADARVSRSWEESVPRQRVRLWTADKDVMSSWRRQLDAAAGPDQQDKLWAWIADTVDYRVRPVKLRVAKR